jgi:hypothetical protein
MSTRKVRSNAQISAVWEKQGHVKRMVWPRIVYWSGFGLTLLGLFYAVTSSSSSTQAGGGMFALIGVLMLMGGKAWMDAVVRGRNRLNCPSCGHVVEASARHCAGCGAAQRTTTEMLGNLHTSVVPSNPAVAQTNSFCSGCGAEAAPRAAFCRACGRALVPSAGAKTADDARLANTPGTGALPLRQENSAT